MKRCHSLDIDDGLDLEVDNTLPLPRGCAQQRLPHGHASQLPPGPEIFAEMFDWPESVIRRTLQLASGKKKLPAKIIMTTAYSGMGSAEVAATWLCEAMKKHGMNVELILDSQTEKEEACEPFLSANHIFGDLTERVDKRLWQKPVRLQDKFIKKAEGLKKGKKGGGKTNAADMTSLGQKFLTEAGQLLEGSEYYFNPKAPSKKCGARCSFAWDRGQEDDATTLWLEVGGNTCPWSSRGARRGWLDKASLASLIWGYSLKFQGAPDCVVNECTPGWPAESFWRMVFPSATVMSKTFSPCDQGVPCHRLRKYSVVWPSPGLAGSRARMLAPLSLDTLKAIAFRKLMCCGSVFGCAPATMVQAFLNELAAAKGLPARGGEKCYSCKVVMVSGDRLRLEKYLGSLQGEDDVNIDSEFGAQ